ncbi:hypothetical protein PUMCH_004813 [Australozyma saopauloensis]|uniref:glucan 1,4-alpha-glucosidase n=1 Tax=Australozyma saopauloensis TaxID=291208 RepID=A0AAX4HGE0_9ASCO|nr:hypothetical protein PUMCH_004813 [[Candida] saopauloensis]
MQLSLLAPLLCLLPANALVIPDAASVLSQLSLSTEKSVQIPFLLLWFSSTDKSEKEEANFEKWLASQKNQSFHYILQNIGGILTVLDTKEVAPGVVIASPLKNHPNYFYNWIRDSALTIRSLISQLEDDPSGDSDYLKKVIEDYILVNYHLQRLPNKSGKFDDNTRSGLGEPKFMADGTTFDEHWGRPQSDGPGLRVVTITDYLDLLEKRNEVVHSDFLGNRTFIYREIVKPDLEYVLANWNIEAFDLWEEIDALHFFNSLTMMRALSEGRRLAEAEDETAEFINRLDETFKNLKSFITDPRTGFAPSTLPFIVETPKLKQQGRRGGLDAATLLAALHSHEVDGRDTNTIPFDVDDHRILNTLLYMVSDMKYRYPVNHDNIRIEQNIGVGLGRYPEDVYDGYGTSEGNPWFISTASAAEVVLRMIYKTLEKKSDLVISSNNREFFSVFMKDLFENQMPDGNIVLPYGSQRYKLLMYGLYDYSDTFLKVIMNHVDSNNGRMSEQFNKFDGYMQGAEDLTWSYLSFYNCARWRLKVYGLILNMA